MMLPDEFTFELPTRIVFGLGVIGQLGECTRPFGKHPLIVTGRRSSRVNGALDVALDAFPGAPIFDTVPENPSTADCDAAGQAARVNGCDVIVAIGGGSPIDVAKAAAGLACNPGGCEDYFGRDMFKKGALPLIAVATTAGAGSEVTPYAVIVNATTGEKQTLAGRDLFPRVAILDPELTITLPPSVTIHTGLDALSQAMEGMVSKKATAMGDVLALEAIRLTRTWLPRAVAEGGDRDARSAMHYAALLAGCVIAQSGTTLVHGMGYPLTLEWGIAHGLANALLLPPLFRHNAHAAPSKVAAIADALGAPCKAEGGAAAKAVSEGLLSIMDAVNTPAAGREHGMTESELPCLAAGIAANPYRYRNQIGQIDEVRILQFYEEAFEGTASPASQQS